MAEKKTDCPCTNRDCTRNRDCEPCRSYHHGRGSLTACERLKSDVKRTRTLKVPSPAITWTAKP
jgi:hypothetical protein